MAKSYVGVFYVGVLKALGTGGAVKAAASVATGSTNSTVGRVGATAATSVEVRLGGVGHPTSVTDRNMHVEVFDTHLVADESSSKALVKKAQDMFNDPDGYAKSHPGELHPEYVKGLKDLKARVAHCVVQLVAIATP